MAQLEYLPDGSVIVDLDGPAWTPLDVFTWVAFGERRSGCDYLFPRAEWSHDWLHWPPGFLACAFDERATGVPWTPEHGGLEWAEVEPVREQARRIMEQTGEDAGALGAALAWDLARSQRAKRGYRNAKEQVMAVIRDGRLTVWGRPRLDRERANNNAAHEALDRRKFIHEPREINEAGWVECSGKYDIGPWWDEVRLDREQVLALWPVSQGIAAYASPLCSFPQAERIAPWVAVSWLAFGTLKAPGHIAQHRSFDQGTVRLPYETEARHRARLDEHKRFDAAEREVLDLLASGQVAVMGQPPAAGVPHKPKLGGHTKMPAGTFADRKLTFDQSGNLIARLPVFERLFPPLGVRGTEASPEHPLWFDLLIEAAGLRQAWSIAPAGQPEPTAGPANLAAIKTTVAAEGRLQAWLENEMRASPNASPGKDRVQARAKVAGHVVSGAGFNRAWAAAVKATGAVAWSAPGAKAQLGRP